MENILLKDPLQENENMISTYYLLSMGTIGYCIYFKYHDTNLLWNYDKKIDRDRVHSALVELLGSNHLRPTNENLKNILEEV